MFQGEFFFLFSPAPLDLTGKRKDLSPESTTELDLLVRTLVSDLRDVQLTMDCVPPPVAANTYGTAGLTTELRVGPLQFPVFGVVASSSPGPAGHSPGAGAAQAASPATRGSLGAWDFSMPARASPGETGRPGGAAAAAPAAAPAAASAAGGRGRAGEMDAAELVRQLQPTDATGSEEEDLYEDEEDEEHAARPRPKT